MTTVVLAPVCSPAVGQTRLGTVAPHVIQPYRASTLPICGRIQGCGCEPVPAKIVVIAIRIAIKQALTEK
ncbi:hypothetical protein DPMN_099330 [Dreissena polymorpha]|uniref:Uncharacterized protein n=1 Tax=Dreissena polymorpha TaxID=45954 RepID=A0A9D4LG92_DREPO|nr:hypothetical protein DPMN_099330 [Dreissena polymorpha]